MGLRYDGVDWVERWMYGRAKTQKNRALGRGQVRVQHTGAKNASIGIRFEARSVARSRTRPLRPRTTARRGKVL